MHTNFNNMRIESSSHDIINTHIVARVAPSLFTFLSSFSFFQYEYAGYRPRRILPRDLLKYIVSFDITPDDECIFRDVSVACDHRIRLAIIIR